MVKDVSEGGARLTTLRNPTKILWHAARLARPLMKPPIAACRLPSPLSGHASRRFWGDKCNSLQQVVTEAAQAATQFQPLALDDEGPLRVESGQSRTAAIDP